MIPREKAPEILAVCISRQQDAIEDLRAQGHKVHDIVLIHYQGYQRLYRLEDGQLRGEDCFKARPAKVDDKLIGAQTEQGSWLRWEPTEEDGLVHEAEVRSEPENFFGSEENLRSACQDRSVYYRD